MDPAPRVSDLMSVESEPGSLLLDLIIFKASQVIHMYGPQFENRAQIYREKFPFVVLPYASCQQASLRLFA